MDYSLSNVIESLPQGPYRPEGGEPLLARLKGATIIRIGAPEDAEVDGGGFVIDYRPAGSAQDWRLVFGFHEGGMWVEYDGALPR